jgi:hypothetical protein
MGVDILVPFPRAIGGYRFLFVAIDKFTKWPEATPVVNITVGVSTPGGSLDRRLNCRRVPQPRWVGARQSTKGETRGRQE